MPPSPNWPPGHAFSGLKGAAVSKPIHSRTMAQAILTGRWSRLNRLSDSSTVVWRPLRSPKHRWDRIACLNASYLPGAALRPGCLGVARPPFLNFLFRVTWDLSCT